MKLTKQKLRQIIKEELMRESLAFDPSSLPGSQEDFEVTGALGRTDSGLDLIDIQGLFDELVPPGGMEMLARDPKAAQDWVENHVQPIVMPVYQRFEAAGDELGKTDADLRKYLKEPEAVADMLQIYFSFLIVKGLNAMAHAIPKSVRAGGPNRWRMPDNPREYTLKKFEREMKEMFKNTVQAIAMGAPDEIATVRSAIADADHIVKKELAKISTKRNAYFDGWKRGTSK